MSHFELKFEWILDTTQNSIKHIYEYSHYLDLIWQIRRDGSMNELNNTIGYDP